MTLQDSSGRMRREDGICRSTPPSIRGIILDGRSTRPSGCMTLQIGWRHGGANWHRDGSHLPASTALRGQGPRDVIEFHAERRRARQLDGKLARSCLRLTAQARAGGALGRNLRHGTRSRVGVPRRRDDATVAIEETDSHRRCRVKRKRRKLGGGDRNGELVTPDGRRGLHGEERGCLRGVRLAESACRRAAGDHRSDDCTPPLHAPRREIGFRATLATTIGQRLSRFRGAL